MSKIKVLVVDDSAVIRRIVFDVVNQDVRLEAVGVAANGKIALSKIPQLAPDLITLHVEMPEMDGIETIREIRKTDKRTPIIMLSSLTKSGAEKTFEALAAGATDYMAKPGNMSNFITSIEDLKAVLIPKIHAHFPQRPVRSQPPEAPQPRKRTPQRSRVRRADRQALCIGTSTGGPKEDS